MTDKTPTQELSVEETSTDRLVRQLECMAQSVGMKFKADPEKVAAFEAGLNIGRRVLGAQSRATKSEETVEGLAARLERWANRESMDECCYAPHVCIAKADLLEAAAMLKRMEEERDEVERYNTVLDNDNEGLTSQVSRLTKQVETLKAILQDALDDAESGRVMEGYVQDATRSALGETGR